MPVNTVCVFEKTTWWCITCKREMPSALQETCQAVYSWQYIHSLHLWGKLLGIMYPNETLEPLIYPLTQVIIGTIK